jgi:small subunit ribosomal protein S18
MKPKPRTGLKMKMKMKLKMKTRGRDKFSLMRKKQCRFCVDKTRVIDYKEVKTLESFIKDRGKVVSVRSSGNCPKHQRRVTEELKKARFLSLIPYVRL